MKKIDIPEITLILDNLRSAFNVGNIFRIADAIKAKQVFCCGYTACPPHPKLAKTAMGADTLVSYRHAPTALQAIETVRSEGIQQVLAIESSDTAPYAWQQDYKFPLAVVLGNEALGVHQETLEACDGIISLPMFGQKESINVGNCAAAVLYAIIAKQDFSTQIELLHKQRMVE